MFFRDALLATAAACAVWAACGLVRSIVAWLRFYALVHRFPGPRPVPLLGNLVEGWRLNTPYEFVSNVIKRLEDTPTLQAWLGPYRIIFLSEPEDVQKILTNRRHVKFHVGKVLEATFGKGLLLLSGEVWRRHRAVISPAFKLSVLNSFMSILNRNGDIFLQKMREKVKKEEKFDLIPIIDELVFDNNCESLIGVEQNSQIRGDSSYLNAMKMRMEAGVQRLTRPWLIPDWLFRWSPVGRVVEQSVKEMARRREELISARRKKLERITGSSDWRSEDEWGRKRKLPFLDTLLQQNPTGEVIEEDEIGEEVDTILTAAQDATSALFQMAFTTLALYPNIQMKVVEELRRLFPATENDPKITGDALNQMTYLDMVMKEVIRISPPLWLSSMRATMEEVHLPSNGLVVPAGATVIVAIKAVHMNRRHYPKPHVFDPERFFPENSAARHPFAFVPFGGGPHICIGRRFGMMQAKVIVAKTLWNFEITPEPTSPPQWSYNVSTKCSNGLFLRLRPRIR